MILVKRFMTVTVMQEEEHQQQHSARVPQDISLHHLLISLRVVAGAGGRLQPYHHPFQRKPQTSYESPLCPFS